MSSSTLAARKQPRQDRSRATVDAIIEAAVELLEHEGYERLTTTRVAERAGVSVGSLYQYFPNKDSIVRALKARTLEGLQAALAEALAASDDLDLEGKVRALVTALLREKSRHPRLGGELIRLMDRLQGDAMLVQVTNGARSLLRRLLEAHRDEVVADIDGATFLLVHGIQGVLDAVVRDPRGRFDDPALHESLVRLVLGFVRV